MTIPAATFAAVAPAPDGLTTAFTTARRRRNSKAAVSAFGGAVAIASVLSFLAPPGQTLVQEPAQPANGDLVPALLEQREQLPPKHAGTGATASELPAGAAVSPPVPAARSTISTAVDAPGLAGDSRRTCAQGRWVACAVVRPPAPGGPTMRASVCPSAARVTVEYSPPTKTPLPTDVSRTVEVGDGSCGSS